MKLDKVACANHIDKNNKLCIYEKWRKGSTRTKVEEKTIAVKGKSCREIKLKCSYAILENVKRSQVQMQSPSSQSSPE